MGCGDRRKRGRGWCRDTGERGLGGFFTFRVHESLVLADWCVHCWIQCLERSEAGGGAAGGRCVGTV